MKIKAIRKDGVTVYIIGFLESKEDGPVAVVSYENGQIGTTPLWNLTIDNY